MNPRGTFCMIFGQHLCDSLLLAEEDHVFKMFVILTALSDFEGIVEMSRVRLAQKVQMTREKVDDALEKLSRPDPESRSQAHEGRRVVEIAQNRWLVVNRKEYSVSGRSAIRKEVKSADNRASYTRRKSKGAPHPVATTADTQIENDDLDSRETGFIGEGESDNNTSHPVNSSTPHPTQGLKLKFNRISATNTRPDESGLNQAESNLTSTSTSTSPSPSTSRSTSFSKSGSPGRGESERGNQDTTKLPAAAAPQRSEPSAKPHWMEMFNDGTEEVRLRQDVDHLIAAAKTRFSIAPTEEKQARALLRHLCERGLAAAAAKTIHAAAKAPDEPLPTFLQTYFSKELPVTPRQPLRAVTEPHQYDDDEPLF